MKYTWYKVLFIVIWCQWVVGMAVLFSGNNGLIGMQRYYLQQKKVDREVLALQSEVANLKKIIGDWRHDDFGKEKMAREQLQMARPTDEIYYIRDVLKSI